MQYTVDIQPTPNPNALKFVVNTPILNTGNVTFKNAAQAQSVPLAKALFALPGVTEVYFFGSFLTVTQDGTVDWDDLEKQVREVILDKIADHDAEAAVGQPAASAAAAASADPEIDAIESILDETIRPFLQRDGGDVQVVSLQDKTLTIFYKGACGGCPSARFGTLRAIEQVLQERYAPDLTVQMA